MECTRCLCDKPHHCTCTMSQASTWLTPQGDRVQRRSLHATRTHTHPFGQTRQAVSCIACMDIPPHAYGVTPCHVIIVSVQMQRAQIVHTPFTTVHVQVVQRSTIDVTSETNRHQTPSPQATTFRIGNYGYPL